MAPSPNMEWYGRLSRKGIRLGLENEEELLRRLGSPQEGLRFIHVAGTDGKGSVCAMIESILRESGIAVGSFTSPEILRINECIRVGGNDIDDRDLELIMGKVRSAAEPMVAEGRECTSFEVLTAAAILFFRTVGAEFAVVEVGMGGRLDSTNVIHPEVVVINRIGLEHIGFLGSTIEQIAFEKAGIMKPAVPCVTINEGPALDVMRRRSAEIGCPLRVISDSDVRVIDNCPDSVEMEYGGTVYRIGLPGRHQARNAALAIEAVSFLRDYGERIAQHVHDGLSSVCWPCRMQKLLVEPIVIDVTHTVEGAECLCSDVSEIYGGAVVVIGMLSDKDAEGVVGRLAPICSKLIVTQPDSPRALPLERMEAAAAKHHRVDATARTVAEAMEKAMDGRGDDIVLVTGSFRMAEGALRWLATRSSRYSTSFQRSTWAERILAATQRG